MQDFSSLQRVRPYLQYIGSHFSISDAGVAGLMGHAAVEGAGYNVRINIGTLNDKAYVERMTAEVARIRAEAEQLATKIRKTVEAKL